MKAVKILAATLVSLLALVVVGAIALVALFDPNDYKGYVTTFVEERTGRSLQIADDLELSFFPWLAIETGGIEIGNAEGFADMPFATVARASARVKVAPLLGGHVEVGMVELDGIELNLGRDENLRGNWEDLIARIAPTAPAEDEPATATPPTELAIAGIRIRDGRIDWRENRTELRYRISGLDLDTSAIGEDAPVDIDAALVFEDVASAVRATLEASLTAETDSAQPAARDIVAELGVARADTPLGTGRLALASASLDRSANLVELGAAELTGTIAAPPIGPPDLPVALRFESAAFEPEAQSLTVASLVTRAGALEARWMLTGETLGDAPRLGGSVELPSAGIADLLALLSLEPPGDLDTGSLGDVTASGEFSVDVDGGRIEVSNLDAGLLGVRIMGDGAFAGDRLTASVVVPAFTPGAALLGLARGRVPEGLDLARLGRLALRADLESNLATGALAVRDLNAELLGGTATGELDLAPGPNGPRLNGALRTTQLPSSAVAPVIERLLPENIEPGELGVLAIDTRFDYDAEADAATLDPLALEAFGLRARGNARVARATSAPSVSGEASLAPFSPRELLRRFGQPVPQTTDATALTQATVTARYTVDAERGRFENIAVALDDSKIGGSFTVTTFANPSFEFDLTGDRIDVDRYLPPPAEEAAEGQRTAGDIELSADSLNAIRIEGRAAVADLKLANLRFQNVSTALAIGAGRATIDSARADLYGGKFDGALLVDTNGEQPTMTLRGKAENLDLKPLIEALVAGEANFRGTGSFDIDLTGAGPTVTDNLRSAGGKMGFALRDGAIEGFNLGYSLCAAYNLTRRQPAPARAPKETRYETIQANATVANGVATSPDLLGRLPFMDVAGKGTISLVEQELDYDLTAKLTGSIGIERCQTMDGHIGDSIPFTLKGTVTDPEIKPDFSKLAREEIKERLQERLLDRLLR